MASSVSQDTLFVATFFTQTPPNIAIMASTIQPTFLMRGHTGLVYEVGEFVVKKARQEEEAKKDHANEQKVFNYFASRPPIRQLEPHSD